MSTKEREKQHLHLNESESKDNTHNSWQSNHAQPRMYIWTGNLCCELSFCHFRVAKLKIKLGSKLMPWPATMQKGRVGSKGRHIVIMHMWQVANVVQNSALVGKPTLSPIINIGLRRQDCLLLFDM